MTPAPRTARTIILVGRLLTPVVAWAVSFLGGWLGALAGQGTGSDYGAVAALAGGAVLGAVAGAGAWWIGITRLSRRWVTPRPSPPRS